MGDDGRRRLTCAHQNLTPEDGEDRAVCADCGAVVTVRLSADVLFAALDRVARGGRLSE